MEKPWSWSIASYVLNHDTERIIEVCNACGVGAIESSPREIQGLRDNEIRDLRQRYADAGISVFSFHLPFDYGDDIASFYETQRRQAVQKMGYWMKAAGLLGAKVVIQHPTTTSWSVDENGLDRYMEQLNKSVQELLPIAKDADLIIGLENMTPGRAGVVRFFTTPEHFRQFRDMQTDPHVGFVYDTGHAVMCPGDQPIEILNAMGDRIVAWHLADNAGDRDSHLAPGYGAVDWESVFQFAKQIGFTNPMTMEAPPWGHGPDYSIETWQKTLNGLDDLVAKALYEQSA